MSKKKDLKFSMKDYLDDVKIEPVLCLRCEQAIDITTQPNGWLHIACEKSAPAEATPIAQ